ncbi:MAG: hypothetical protein AAB486_01675 [Patescibacteria group bacterium]
MDNRKKALIFGGLIVLVLLFRFGGKISLPSFGGGGQESSGTSQVYVPQEYVNYLKDLPGFDPTTIISGGIIPERWAGMLRDKYPMLISPVGNVPLYFPPETATGQSAFAPTFTPQPTLRPTRTSTPIVVKPMTGTTTIEMPPAVIISGISNSTALGTYGVVDGKSNGWWIKFDGSCGSLWCRPPRFADIPMKGQFKVLPALEITEGVVRYQQTNVDIREGDDHRMLVELVIGPTTQLDMNSGSEDTAPEVWTVSKVGDRLVALKQKIQRWDAMTVRITPLELIVYFGIGTVDGIAPTSTPATTPTPTPTATATKPAAKSTPTRTPTRGR